MTNNAIIKDTSPTPDAAVIWMHGLGADGSDFLPIVNELEIDDLQLRFVFPNAPYRAVTINQGMHMPAWYDLRKAQFTQDEDRDGIKESRQRISAIIDTMNQQGIASNRIVLAGFSQGGAMALYCGLRHHERLAGILALSSYLPLAENIAAEATPENKETPIMMAQGLYDSVVPHATAFRSLQQLQKLGYNVAWHEYPMEHTVVRDEIQDIGKWLRQTLEHAKADAQ